MIVDAHNHLIADDLEKYPMTPIEPSAQMDWSKNIHLTAEEFLAHMDEAGVEKAVVVQPSTFHGYDNSYLADSIDRHRDRLVGNCNINVRAEDAVEKLDYWITERGLHGVRLFTVGPTIKEPATWLDDPAIDPFWTRAVELDIPIEIQTWLQYIPLVHNVLQRHPKLKVVLGSGTITAAGIAAGPPNYGESESMIKLASNPNVVAVKFTTGITEGNRSGARRTEGLLPVLASTFGADRMLWGTNFPATRPYDGVKSPYKVLVDEAREVISCLTEEEQRWAFGDTAAKVYPALRQQVR